MTGERRPRTTEGGMGAGRACKVGTPHNAADLRILGMHSGHHADAAAEIRHSASASAEIGSAAGFGVTSSIGGCGGW
jgi:hypothetical protein